MKIDKYVKAVARRLDNVTANSNDCNGYSHSHSHCDDDEPIIFDDEYYISLGFGELEAEVPPRFLYYNYIREKKLALKNLEQERRPTLDELEFFLKRNLAEPPELRYQRRKEGFLFHDLSCYMRGLSEEDYGCTGAGCISECRFYNKYGRFEDEEVITEYKDSIEYYRKKNAIVYIEPPDEDTLKEFLREFYNNK